MRKSECFPVARMLPKSSLIMSDPSRPAFLILRSGRFADNVSCGRIETMMAHCVAVEFVMLKKIVWNAQRHVLVSVRSDSAKTMKIVTSSQFAQFDPGATSLLLIQIISWK